MIRFACPGCSATFTVDDEKAGKTGKCPKCQAQFVIPALESGVVPNPPAEIPPPLPTGAAPVEIDPCPKCQTRLSVGAGDVGLDVECPYCKTVFKATTGGGKPKGPPPAPGGEERPSRRRRDDDEDDDRPRSRRRPDDDEDDDRPSRRRRRDDDDEEDDERPSRRRRSRRRSSEESKRVMAGSLAIIFGFFLGIPVHKFILGYTTTGIIQLVITIATCWVGAIIQIIEGIIYLTKSDDEFVEMYQENEKHWF